MKTIKLLLCVLLTAMSFNVFANEVGRYQMLEKTPSDNDKPDGIYVLDTITGAIKYCFRTGAEKGMMCMVNIVDTRGIRTMPP